MIQQIISQFGEGFTEYGQETSLLAAQLVEMVSDPSSLLTEPASKIERVHAHNLFLKAARSARLAGDEVLEWQLLERAVNLGNLSTENLGRLVTARFQNGSRDRATIKLAIVSRSHLGSAARACLEQCLCAPENVDCGELVQLQRAKGTSLVRPPRK
jgi:hypothetical protein